MNDWTRIQSEIEGFAIGKPPEWTLTGVQDVADGGKRIQLSAPEMTARIETLAAAPLVAMSRYPVPHRDLNPSVQVALRPLGPMAGAGPVTVLEAVAAPMAQMLEGFKPVEAPHPVDIGGHPAAAMRATCAIAGSGPRMQVMARTWVVPVGDYVFIIGMTDKASGSELPDAVFQQILESIEISA